MILFIIACACLLLCFCIGGCVFFAACSPYRKINWLDEREVSKTPYGRFYSHIRKSYNWLQCVHAQDIYTESDDGLRLHATWVPVEKPRGTILMVHGYHSCIYTDFGLVMQMYHDMGFNLLMPDQRGHGKSEGRYVTFGIKESGDMLRWIDWHNRFVGANPMFLSGLSMGASTVMYLADEALPENVRFLIVDCGFTSPYEIISEVYRQRTHLPPFPVMWAAELFAVCFGKFSLKEKNSVVSLAQNTHPILMVHGTADHFVPCEMTKKAFSVCSSEKSLLLVDDAGHGVSYLKATDAYLEQIQEMVKQYIPV